jgi:hypothetical protein
MNRRGIWMAMKAIGAATKNAVDVAPTPQV